MRRYRNFGSFVLLAALWGSAFVAIKAGLQFFPPVLFAAIRYDVAGIFMLGYAAYAVDDPIPRTREQWLVVANGAVLMIAAYHALLFVGEADPAVTSAAAAVIVSLGPVLTTGFARVLLPTERLTTAGLAGMLLALIGVGVLADPNPNDLLAGGVVAKLLVFGAAASFALGSVFVQRTAADLSIETMEAWSMLGGAGILHLLSLGLGEKVAEINWTASAVGALAYLSLVASALGFLLYFDLLERLGAVEINLVSYVGPIWAALVGWLLLAETPSLATWIGFVIIFAGFVLIKRAAIRQELPRLRREFRAALPWR